MALPRRQYNSELRERRARSTRDAIVDAAALLLTADRPPSISVLEIADAAGVGVATRVVRVLVASAITRRDA